MRTLRITLEHLTFSWPGGREILRDISGTFHLDGVTALCGPNGCGKSTLLDLLAGKLAPAAGALSLSPTDPLLAGQRMENLRASPGQTQRRRLDELFREDGLPLFLDEPTNHLDAQALGTLERRLRRRTGPTLLVSHDRDLLDRVARRTLWLEDGGLWATEGGFTQAWQARAARNDGRIAEREAHDARLRRAKSALQSRRESAQAANRDRTAGRRMKDAHDRDATSMAADFRFRSAQTNLGRATSRLRGEIGRLESESVVAVRRDTLRDFDFPWSAELASRRLALPAGEAIAPDGTSIRHDGIALDGRTRLLLDGPNGSGKSSVMRALDSLGSPGVLHLPQESSLDQDLSFLESLRAAPPGQRGRILTLAAALGASGEALRETARPSPGESRKLRLATMLASPSWMLLLDEPTNHLDAASIQNLQEALERWPGGLVMATHDRRLRTATTTATWTLQDRRLVQG